MQRTSHTMVEETTLVDRRDPRPPHQSLDQRSPPLPTRVDLTVLQILGKSLVTTLADLPVQILPQRLPARRNDAATPALRRSQIATIRASAALLSAQAVLLARRQ